MIPPAKPLSTIYGKDLEIVTKIVKTTKRNPLSKNLNPLLLLAIEKNRVFGMINAVIIFS